ncbi:MAG: ribosomal RNA small subunit methyltransferase A [Ignavibacteria bacterium GWA2_55_11]|nr:MAG: ribosomal RNA small subunit methyltransferase A [Ignavibacteria bacterium GWA2_55_11]OGU44580.1 MAG: ribosomal RNA small subunit methyltransferase A [Ignavibacteria bacterium GWC2_56_12]OGU63263.1 MAG: ribosomal RNA small subunit methyltransferase A [Ignavibacteria bacterium RIFCSPHIGHO2_02_FULL_56_12]OGU70978.1 MAG: ribosomal RNA small subunit methyltransferase A [Ignavibacteria bacterium RIFCSPLOWO2_02_FULL_55_14]HAV23603.1 ribosomal RNA small subunit methyltransferase A [Bacteroidota
MISPRKSLGQNFLQDDNIVRKIVASLELKPEDRLVEIGPGTGALTKALVGMCRLSAVEIDRRAVGSLREVFGDRLDVIEADIRKVEARSLAPEGDLRVVGNIPYYITSEILFWVFDQRVSVRDATLMMQQEVAERLTAHPRTKAYGILSVFAQHYAVPERLFAVSRNCFYPRPDVDSSIVRLTLKSSLPAVDDALFRKVVRTTFGKRRKTIRNGLSFMGLTKTEVNGLGDVVGRRPEELTPAEFVVLARMIGELVLAKRA